MRREPHVRFCESVGVKLSRATLPEDSERFDLCGGRSCWSVGAVIPSPLTGEGWDGGECVQ